VTAKRVDVPLFDLVRELALERKRALRTDAGEGKPTCQFPPLDSVARLELERITSFTPATHRCLPLRRTARCGAFVE
jgi:hypothetical protein